jgi:hypothetical protein
MNWSYSAIFLGLIMIGFGFSWLHKISKKSPIVHRVGAILLFMIGGSFIWSSAASNVPAMINRQMDIINSGPGWLIARVEYDKARECKVDKVQGFIINNKDKSIEVETTFLLDHNISKIRGLSYVILKYENLGNPDNLKEFKVVIRNICPFGFEIDSKFDPVKLRENRIKE